MLQTGVSIMSIFHGHAFRFELRGERDDVVDLERDAAARESPDGLTGTIVVIAKQRLPRGRIRSIFSLA